MKSNILILKLILVSVFITLVNAGVYDLVRHFLWRESRDFLASLRRQARFFFALKRVWLGGSAGVR